MTRRLTLGGYGGVAVGWVEGIEINILGAVVGVDIRHPAIKLPGFGRIGIAISPPPEPPLRRAEAPGRP